MTDKTRAICITIGPMYSNNAKVPAPRMNMYAISFLP